ncbi:MAG: LysR family transcriptional regulator [Devosia sp.]
MNLRSLRIFRRIVTLGSLAQASRELNISPSAASRLISLLESELGLTLFARHKRRLELTEEGDRFYRETEHILRGLDEMSAVSRDIRQQTNNRLRLVTAAPLAMGIIAPTLALMRRKGMEFECDINVETRFGIESKVAARAFNFGIISVPMENAIVELTVEPFLEARVGVLMRADHPLANCDVIEPEALVNQPIVALHKGQRWRDRTDEVFSGAGLAPPIPIETTSTPIVTQLVRDGLGLTIVDRVCGRIMQGEALVLRPLAQERWVTYATIHPRGPRPALERDFVQSMRDFVVAERQSNPDTASSLRLINIEAP